MPKCFKTIIIIITEHYFWKILKNNFLFLLNILNLFLFTDFPIFSKILKIGRMNYYKRKYDEYYIYSLKTAV